MEKAFVEAEMETIEVQLPLTMSWSKAMKSGCFTSKMVESFLGRFQMSTRLISLIQPKENMIEPLKKIKNEEIVASFLSGTKNDK